MDNHSLRQSLQAFVRTTLGNLLAPKPQIEGLPHVLEVRSMATMSGVNPVEIDLGDRLEDLSITSEMLNRLRDDCARAYGLTLKSDRLFSGCMTVKDLVDRILAAYELENAVTPSEEVPLIPEELRGWNHEQANPWGAIILLGGLIFVLGIVIVTYILTKG